MTIAYQGIGIHSTRAIALGPALVDSRSLATVGHVEISDEQVPAELERLERAIASARGALEAVRAQIPTQTPQNIAEFIDTHLLMLEDAALVEEVRRIVSAERCSAEWALQQQRDTLVRIFDEMDDPYLRTRRDDVEHVVHQIQSFLAGDSPEPRLPEHDLDGHVVVARDLTPADTILLHHRGIAGFVTEFGGPMSHTAILARSLGVPAVIGVRNITRYIEPREFLVVDGENGTVLCDADDLTIAHFRDRVRAAEARQRRLRRLIGRAARTRDGIAVGLQANLELPEDVETARANGAAGVGLYRTEFLYMNRLDLPDEEEQFASYAAMIEGLGGIPTTIRTLDLGADKDSAAQPIEPSGNPALGLRAIRLCLKEPALFRPQLRAILRASALGPVRLMLPMVSGVREVVAVRQLLEQLKRELASEGLAHDPALPLGAMIEVPAAALAAGAIARHCDFLSIGTNDLIQYTLAIDRLDDAVNDLYDPTHPAILRLIRMTIEAGRTRGIPVGMCGEMAGDARFTRLLLGLGLREFSMQPGALLDVKEVVLTADTRTLQQRTETLFARLDETDPQDLLAALNTD
ncbi:phosphoenolpyruvate-protein phosphotransferase [Marichromatium purpuratum 984]|uniref:Phosphoenolpyruvate-protein phosphotransferase n=1 Tax=Marichromatium purpuratum 984 TaxID=765910 RepID=W0E0G6_MARPU|nr:phosphoenolpyruvate--protein phosphotransferase [Marichromatium purpuratum]AHF02699.1 phosphoenolpyruvate-protein phosphotransferase [Marichromatium purpuratum 984]